MGQTEWGGRGFRVLRPTTPPRSRAIGEAGASRDETRWRKKKMKKKKKKKETPCG